MKVQKKHPTAIRWFHWIHFPLLSLMVWSGLLIYWSNDVYRVGVGSFTLIRFFPKGFYDFFELHHRLAEGMSIHFFLMWLFAINGLAYFFYTLISGEWRDLLPDRKAFREAVLVVLHDLHLIKTPPLPRGKFNGAQRIAYSMVVLMGGASLLTGLGIYKPIQVSWITSLLGGYEAARFEHFWLTLGYCFFFLIHIAQVIRAGSNQFRAMITGYEEVAPLHEPTPRK